MFDRLLNIDPVAVHKHVLCIDFVCFIYLVVALFVVGVGWGGIFYALMVSLLSTLFIYISTGL